MNRYEKFDREVKELKQAGIRVAGKVRSALKARRHSRRNSKAS